MQTITTETENIIDLNLQKKLVPLLFGVLIAQCRKKSRSRIMSIDVEKVENAATLCNDI